MMNDVRGQITPVETTGKTEKIVAALIVALGFVAIGAVAYETGSGNSQPKQVAAHEQVPAPAPQTDVASSAPQSTADLQPTPDVPAAAPAPKAAAPTEKAAALTLKAPEKTPSEAKPTPPVRVARAPDSAPQAPAAQPGVSAEASAQIAAPAEKIPEQAAPQEFSPPPPASAPTQEAPAREAAEPLATPAPQQ